MRTIILCIVVLLFMGVDSKQGSNRLHADQTGACEMVPKPQSFLHREGHFIIGSTTVIYSPSDSDDTVELGAYLAEHLRTSTGYTLKVTSNPIEIPLNDAIILSLKTQSETLGNEGYRMKIRSKTVGIAASTSAGLFYGIQSLRQALKRDDDGNWTVPCMDIEDKPSYEWRGLLMDSARHFMTTDFIKRYIDLLAYHKMNTLHLHLTDDQGWRIDIKRYPLLTEVGAWRNEGGKRYGGFYTKEELKDIIEYAASRYITVIPEIEMPGHATAAVAAYPEIFCAGADTVAVETTWGIHKNLFCAGKEKTFEFLENVLDEVCDVFPSQYIHIGGDEAKKDHWEKCPDCQKRMQELGIEDEGMLQGYFNKRIEKFLASRGRRTIGWDEILEGGMTSEAIVQSWRGMEGADEGSKLGMSVISSPHDYTYFDYPMHSIRSKAFWMITLPLERVYSFNPAPDELTPEQRALILGSECTIWSEYAPQPEVDQQVFPRLCAFAEVVWTRDEVRNWDDFTNRMTTHFTRLEYLGVDYYKPDVQCGDWAPGSLSETPGVIEWDITGVITGEGHYRLTFDADEGEHGIHVDWVALSQNGIEISRDTHLFESGKENMFQTYRFDVDNYQENAVYTLRASMGGHGGTDTKGSLWIKRFKVAEPLDSL
ncbi:beta-N-acetylhexosaminidase [Candidatus Latescibacterota bacterium]